MVTQYIEMMMEQKLKIVILSDNKTQMEAMRQALQDAFADSTVITHSEAHGALAELVSKEQPDIAIIDAAYYQSDVAMAELEHLLHQTPALAVIQVSDNLSPSCLMNAMHIGVREVLPLPVESVNLVAAVSRLAKKIGPAVNRSTNGGKVLAFIACKGGSGATFIATNLAYILAEKHHVKVAFIDLNLHFGDAALFLNDQEPPNNVADVAENIARLDASFLAASMLQISPDMRLLAAPDNPERAVTIRPEHIDVILRLARTHYDYVILDIGRALNAVSVRALDQVDMIFPVLQETLPFIRDSKRLIHTLQSLGYSDDKIQPIVNRHEKNGQILLKDVEAAIGLVTYKTIPNSYENVSASVNQGIPIYKIDKRDAVTVALMDMADDLVAKPQNRKQGWLSRVLHTHKATN